MTTKPTKAAPARKATRKPKKPPSTESRLGVRGRRMWVALHELVDGERGLVLLEEACRIADRLDGLAEVLAGKPELVRVQVEEGVGTFIVDGALVEARQQANVLRQLVAALPLKEARDGDDDEGWLGDLSSPVLNTAPT